jgi:YVTN family beta-propeller protein
VAVVNGATWDVDRKFAFPSINMNHPHNMWSNADQSLIYQTQWFDNKLTSFDRVTGEIKDTKIVGEAASHVMTNPNFVDPLDEKIYVAMNGEDFVAELSANPDGTLNHLNNIPTQNPGDPPTNPHGHWISADGKYMVTPNAFTADSTIYDFDTDTIQRVSTGAVPIATSMMPDGSKYYVANLLSHTISVIDTASATKIKDIQLLQNYDGTPTSPISGLLPIQTPTSPDGNFVVTATLWPSITIVNTSTDTLVATLECDAGCHGVQFGAKDGGGYYAYVSSKFSNDLIVVDPDPNGDDDGTDAAIVGRISLVAPANDDTINGLNGFGGQGVLPVPNVYNGWVQNTVDICNGGDCSLDIDGWIGQLSCQQKDPINPGACSPRVDPEPSERPLTAEPPITAKPVQSQRNN